MVTVPPQLSPVEVALPVLLGSVESPHWSSLSGGQVMVGTVSSSTVMIWSQVAKLPQTSVAL